MPQSYHCSTRLVSQNQHLNWLRDAKGTKTMGIRAFQCHLLCHSHEKGHFCAYEFFYQVFPTDLEIIS